MDQITIVYLVLSLLFVVFIMISPNYGPLGILIIIFSIIAGLLILLLAYADYLVYPLFTRFLKIVTISGKDYYIPKSQDAIITYKDGLYFATGYLTANVYNYVFQAEKVNEDEDTDMKNAPDNWEKATANINFPFRYNVVSTVLDIQKHRDELEARRGIIQFQYSSELQNTNPNPVTIDEIQRRIRIVEARISRLGQGERPLTAMMYIESVAVGITEKEAMDTLAAQLNQLQTVFNIFDLSIIRVIGREVYHLHKLSYVIPSMDHLASVFQFQR